MTETIGFVGLGIMGLPMAKNLERGGPVCGHDLREARLRLAGAEGRAGSRVLGFCRPRSGRQ